MKLDRRPSVFPVQMTRDQATGVAIALVACALGWALLLLVAWPAIQEVWRCWWM